MKQKVSKISQGIILVTLALFVAAVFSKGLTHDLFLEVAVFLVSVKLILLSNENRKLAHEIYDKVSDLHSCMCAVPDKSSEEKDQV